MKSMPAAAAANSLQSCPTLCNPIDGSPPGSPVPGILQARTLEWGAISFLTQKIKHTKKIRQKTYHIYKKIFGKFPMHTNVVKGLRNHAGKKWIPPTDSSMEPLLE